MRLFSEDAGYAILVQAEPPYLAYGEGTDSSRALFLRKADAHAFKRKLAPDFSIKLRVVKAHVLYRIEP